MRRPVSRVQFFSLCAAFLCVSLLDARPVGPMVYLAGFGARGEAVTYQSGEHQHPEYSYAWYPRPYQPAQVGQDAEYTGVVTENNGVPGLSARGGFQPVHAEGLEPGSVVWVKGKLIVHQVRPYWTDTAIAVETFDVVYSVAQVAQERERAARLWQSFVANTRYDLSCRTTRRNYKLGRPRGTPELLTNWDGERAVFLFSYAESDGMPRSVLVRDFFLAYDPKHGTLTEVFGLCRFWEDLC